LQQIQSARLPTIDGLRGLAILAVMLCHCPGLFGVGVAGRWNRGVDLFFVVSGYLITGILLSAKDRREPMRVFWRRRAVRIFPLAYLYLGVVALLTLAGLFPELAVFLRWHWYVFYAANADLAARGWPPLPFVMLWSLAIEEQVYLVWPFLVRLLRPAWLASVCGLIILLSPTIRAAEVAAHGINGLFATAGRLDGIAAGGLVALAFRFCGPWFPRACVWSSPMALIVIGISLTPTAWGFDDGSFLNVAFAVVLVASMRSRAVSIRPLVWIGQRCYGLYMWHLLVGLATSWVFGRGWAPAALWVALTCGVAHFSFRFESWFLEIRRHDHREVILDASTGPNLGRLEVGESQRGLVLPDVRERDRERGACAAHSG
jgi:peptidoglycan/LPS O-acetylase OafA/YrhL